MNGPENTDLSLLCASGSNVLAATESLETLGITQFGSEEIPEAGS